MTNSDGFDRVAGDFDFVAIVISRREVESGNVGDVVDRLMKLSDTKENVEKFRSSVVISFEGYDNDPRPLGSIPECVSFFRAVHRCWPYWYHFLVKVPDMFSVLLTLLLETRVVTRAPGVVVQEVVRPEEIREQMMELFGPMNALYESFGIGMPENRKMTDEVVAVMAKCLG